VRWRIAAVSAALTLVILIGFAVVVGQLTSDRIQDNFRDEVRGAATGLALAISVQATTTAGRVRIRTPDLNQIAMSNDSVVRIVGSDGRVFGQSDRAPELGPVTRANRRLGSLEVATRPLLGSGLGVSPLFVQYARDRSGIEQTVDRLWLFLGGGVLIGTVLAALGGFAVAGRAMRPIASLTAAAHEIATTRDPSMRIPEPETDDEIAELARTLDNMLRELDAARSETEQAMQRQREFVADASHELRTPLTSILANLELLQGSLGPSATDGEASLAAESALRSSRRMTRLVADLLLLARADAGRQAERLPCDLTAIAIEAAAEVAPLANGREIEIDAPAPVPIDGSADELHRMVLNLLENAARHTPDGTHVRLALANRDAQAVLEVSDDGPGLPAGMEDQVFERFVRGSGPADLAKDGEGTGLGLAIVRAVAEAHGGQVEALNGAQRGARFVVTLPIDA
jgi:two-component system OmpR family sensor kinase